MPNPRTLRTAVSRAQGLLFLVLLPAAAVLAGVYGPGGRSYLWAGIAILLFSLSSFFLALERRRPQARDLVTLSVLSALAVAGRAAFAMLPQCKPMAAVIILTGACLGAQPGFLVGASSVFVSNFFFGQGPNTPWQMFAFGLIGLLSGALFAHGPMKTGRLSLCLFGALSVFFVYGGIVNLGTLLISGLPPTLSSLLAVVAAGVPFDLMHAGATVLFLLLLTRPMTEKLNRMKVKYGLLDWK